MFCLFNFHLALYPPHSISMQNVSPSTQPLDINDSSPHGTELGPSNKKTKNHSPEEVRTPKKVKIQEIDLDPDFTKDANTPHLSTRLASKPSDKSLRDPSSSHDMGNSISTDKTPQAQLKHSPLSVSSTHVSDSPTASLSLEPTNYLSLTFRIEKMMVVEEASSVKEEDPNLAELGKKIEALSDTMQVITSKLEATESKMHDVSKFALNVMRCSATSLCLLQDSVDK